MVGVDAKGTAKPVCRTVGDDCAAAAEWFEALASVSSDMMSVTKGPTKAAADEE